MKTSEAIKDIMKKQGVSQYVMAKRINTKTQSVVAMRLASDNITTQKANEMLKVLGYKIVLMPDTMRTPNECYEVE